jgi:tetratricopeptide (TPR) repeat protein
MDLADELRAGLPHRYEIEREIGRGGMGRVFLARDSKLGRQVAIKAILPELSESIAAERFLDEIAIAASLQHAHILPLHDSGTVGRILYYVMPYVEGESLAARLRRSGPLRVKEVIQIAQHVAEGLEYAHEKGFVHRDIKPDNILLSHGDALIADFGIARAMEVAGSPRTTPGIAIGTPEYMSPEQAGGSSRLDGRSDIYALGCVVYEMLAGEPPFTGPSAEAIIRRQMQERIPSLAVVRPNVESGVVAAVEKALAKVPADRFDTPTEFASALEAAAEGRLTLREVVRRIGQLLREHRLAASLALAGGIVLVLLTQLTGISEGGKGPLSGSPPDTTHYAIFPFEYQPGVDVELNEVQLLHDALSRWTGLSIVDPMQIREVIGRRNSAPVTNEAASKLVLSLGAGRYVRGELSRIGDSLRVRAALYETADARLLADDAIRLPTDLAGADSGFALLADRVLFRGSLPRGVKVLEGTRSLPARQSFARGQEALGAWNLSLAESTFSFATDFDPGYSQAHLWLALVRAWTDAEPARWRVAAEQAALGTEHLSARDQAMSLAVLAQVRGDFATACARWTILTERNPRDYAAWYGAARCLGDDDVVLRDPSSPSGWRFRTSYWRAIAAYRRAFELHPPILASFRTRSFRPMRVLLRTNTTDLRLGRATGPDTGLFAAYPGLEGDTLALVPWRLTDIASARPPASTVDAVRRQRRVFHEIALAWATDSPTSPDAMEALAVSLEMLSNPSALDTLRRARDLAGDSATWARTATAEVWLRIKHSTPADLEGLRTAGALTDSILKMFHPDSAPVPDLLASVAAVTGRAGLAGRLLRKAGRDGLLGASAPVSEIGPAFLAFAALGGPHDTLVELERAVAETIERLPKAERVRARLTWLARPASLAFPDWVAETLPSLRDLGDPLVDMQAAFHAGETEAVHAGFESLRATRASARGEDLTIDALYPEARLLVALGESAAAAEWIDPTLNALSATGPDMFTDVARAGTLVRAIALRADLAERIHETEAARQWASIVAVLWDEADAFLQPLVGRMRKLMR